MTIKRFYTSSSSSHPKSSAPRYPLTHYPNAVLKHLLHRTPVMTEADKVTEALDETEMIAPDGDVILIVGPDKARLRVHSHALKMASKVFSAMLGPHFREGQGLNGFLPREISIPDDDPDAMLAICNVLHHCNNSLPNVISPISIVRVAIAADKYDCVVALKYVMSHWLDFTGITNSLELVYLAAAAYLFNNARGFEEATRRLIFGHRGSYTSLAEDEYGAVVPWKAFSK
ncbi:hypothetical protein N7G274_009576 [Stereocaulon virgatum]|uniref:BTB domain-containing protein n=1 Tax=Stereocaulon virgatum TaxID=373712 RepID=A0ABR3ZXE9_9LECA